MVTGEGEVVLAQPAPFAPNIDNIIHQLDPEHKLSTASHNWLRNILKSFQKGDYDRKMKQAAKNDAYRKGLEQVAEELGKPKEEIVSAWMKGVQ